MCSVEGATDHHMRQLAKRRRRGDLYTAQEGNFKETEQGRSAGPAPIDPFFHVDDAVRRHLSQLLYRDEAANGDWSARIARLESACQDRDQGGLKCIGLKTKENHHHRRRRHHHHRRRHHHHHHCHHHCHWGSHRRKSPRHHLSVCRGTPFTPL